MELTEQHYQNLLIMLLIQSLKLSKVGGML